MENVILHNLQLPFHKALEQGNSTATGFATPYLLTQTEPVQPTVDGIWPASNVVATGEYSPQRLILAPYAMGSPGAQFSVRLLGWRILGSNPLKLVWLPMPLVELLCTIGAIPGPPGGGPGPVTDCDIQPGENFCDDMSLTNGALGQFGEIVTWTAGSGIIAFACVDLRGCQKFSFDFSGDGQNAMNCLWARL